MSDILVTGFPGFLASALLPRLLARRDGARALCVVQAQHLTTARHRVDELVASEPDLAGRVVVVEGDITEPWLGLRADDRAGLADVSEVWHLAAVYDLTVGEQLARRVNVEGTARVLEVCAALRGLSRLQYVSTCYVSGRYDGVFAEDSLDEGQSFLNHYEATKFDAEMLVRKAMAGGLPATIYRPGIVVGDSVSGATQKYDGPYFLASFLRRQGPIAVVPAVGDADRVRISLVPRDFVIRAMDELSVLDCSLGRTYALTDPHPPTVRTLVDTFAHHLGKRVVWVPLPLRLARTLLGGIPGLERLLGIPAEGLDYFASSTTYSTTATERDLQGTGVRCPAFADYADTLLDFMADHPEVGSAAMV
ncbi:SDR family oxidoreductase [Longivirga aurantiaca]|uniref:SDR family oxidoreductase n=1 Tax=Longivirga aurantiaca TaxID=1837743 RepID=A0ABW1T336_9ACTN